MTVSYFLNAPSLSTATAIYMNSDMTVLAPDGFYGQDGIVRQMLNGSLLPEQVCAECSQPCGIPISYEGYIYGQGVYIMNVEVGAGTGAIIIRTDPLTVPKGYSALFNSIIYNKFSSPEYGYLAAPSTEVTYIGDMYFDCGLVAGSPHTLQVYRWDGSDFVISPGEFQAINITDPNLQLTLENPESCVMVIPKTAATPSVVQLSIISGCPNANFDVEVECVAALTGYASSIRYATSTEACGGTVDQTYYSVPVNGSGGLLGLYDWVFSDINGQNVLPDGYYYSPPAIYINDWYRVENGVVVEFGTCPVVDLLGWEVRKDITAACGLNVTNLRLQVNRGVIPILDVYYPSTGNIPVIADATFYTFKLSFTWANITPSCCDMKLVLDYNGLAYSELVLPTPPVNGDYYEVLLIQQIIPTNNTIYAYIECV